MKEQKLKRITKSDRRVIGFAVSQNRRWKKWQQAKLDSEFGPHTCGHCRAEPCGAQWPAGACCHRCTHLPMPDWRLTHVLWYRKKPYFVMEVAARRPGADAASAGARFKEQGSSSGSGSEPQAASRKPRAELDDEQRWGVQRSPVEAATATDAVYYRWDGVCQWVRRARTHYFLGVRVSPVEFLRSLPNEEERAEFVPRERPPNPFEQGVSAEEDDAGDPFSDQTEREPEEPDDGRRYEKRGLQVADPGEARGIGQEDDDDG